MTERTESLTLLVFESWKGGPLRWFLGFRDDRRVKNDGTKNSSP